MKKSDAVFVFVFAADTGIGSVKEAVESRL